MLSERVVSLVTRTLNQGYLHDELRTDIEHLPPAEPDKLYMLYVHVPFCRQLCTYCSFNRFFFEEGRATNYFDTLLQEMEMVANLGYRFGAMYIGGGTPTVMLDQLVRVIDRAKELFPDIQDVSSETNPTDLGDELYQALGGRIDRLSVGVQSFDNGLLHQMGRLDTTGSAEETLAAVQSMRGKFKAFNVDMIYNFPSQTMEGLARDIDMVKQTGCNQVTFYPLMASPLRRKQLEKNIGKIDYGREFEMYKMINDGLSEVFVPSSAWTFSADPDMIIDEYVVDYPSYVGIGSGAMSRIDGVNYTNTFSLREYHDRVKSGRMGIVKQSNAESKISKMRYTFASQLFGLRLDKAEFKATHGVPVELALGWELAYFHAVGGIKTNTSEEITLTDKGRYLLVAIMRETLARSNDYRDQAREALPKDEYAELLLAPPGPAILRGAAEVGSTCGQ